MRIWFNLAMLIYVKDKDHKSKSSQDKTTHWVKPRHTAVPLLGIMKVTVMLTFDL